MNSNNITLFDLFLFAGELQNKIGKHPDQKE